MTEDTASLDRWLAAATSSHHRLAAQVADLTAEQVAGPSYAAEWSVAQVLSHLGSGAEIFILFVEAGRRGEPAPGPDAFQPIWERWNAKPPEMQAADALVSDRKLLDELHGLSEAERQGWVLSMFGAEQRLSDVVRLRLGEHALHTWDVEVTRNPTAVIAPDAVGLLIDTMGSLVARTGTPVEAPLRVNVVTHDPARRFLLVAGAEGAALEGLDNGRGPDAGSSPAAATLELPAEAFIRLLYGRLDPAHAPALQTAGVDLDVLRRIFPGV